MPWLNYEEIRKKANSFLEEHHPSKTIPIPIEEIAEFKLKLDIRPLPGLRNIDVDGFLNSDLSAISVDQAIFEHVNPSRYRFTLAHEIGHLVLHSQLYRESIVRNISSYQEFVRNLPQYLLGKVEWQAYCFAGLVLVPQKPLKQEVEKVIKDVKGTIENVPDDIKIHANAYFLQTIVEEEVAKSFEVSSQVISKRMKFDKLDELITELLKG